MGKEWDGWQRYGESTLQLPNGVVLSRYLYEGSYCGRNTLSFFLPIRVLFHPFQIDTGQISIHACVNSGLDLVLSQLTTQQPFGIRVQLGSFTKSAWFLERYTFYLF